MCPPPTAASQPRGTTMPDTTPGPASDAAASLTALLGEFGGLWQISKTPTATRRSGGPRPRLRSSSLLRLWPPCGNSCSMGMTPASSPRSWPTSAASGKLNASTPAPRGSPSATTATAPRSSRPKTQTASAAPSSCPALTTPRPVTAVSSNDSTQPMGRLLTTSSASVLASRARRFAVRRPISPEPPCPRPRAPPGGRGPGPRRRRPRVSSLAAREGSPCGGRSPLNPRASACGPRRADAGRWHGLQHAPPRGRDACAGSITQPAGGSPAFARGPRTRAGLVLRAIGVGDHGIVDIAREPWRYVVIGRRIPGVGGVHLGQATVPAVPTVEEPARKVLAVRLGEVHRHGARGRLTGPQGLGESPDVRVGLTLDGDPVSLGIGSRPPLGLLPCVRVTPALLGLLRVLIELVCAEDLELLLGSQRDSHLPCLHLFLDRVQQRLVPGLPLAQHPVLPAQVIVGPGVWIGEDLRYLVQSEIQLAVEQDLLQAPKVRAGVQAVAGRAPPARGQQPDVVVVVQCPHRYVRQAGHVTDGVFLHGTTAFIGPLCSLTPREGQARFRGPAVIRDSRWRGGARWHQPPQSRIPLRRARRG